MAWSPALKSEDPTLICPVSSVPQHGGSVTVSVTEGLTGKWNEAVGWEMQGSRSTKGRPAQVAFQPGEATLDFILQNCEKNSCHFKVWFKLSRR